MRIASPLSRSWLWTFVCSLSCVAAVAQPAAAQTWSLGRSRPSLFEIIAVDPISEPNWPFGNEDLASDGQVSTTDAEASIDLRSVYADARAGRLWLRAYVSSRRTNASTTAFTAFFIDGDLDPNTGGPAEALSTTMSKDPSRAGYEVALAVKPDGKLLGIYHWDKKDKLWAERDNPEQVAVSERAVARDPLRLLGDERVYAQVNVALSELKLDERCLAQIFVRTWNEQPDELAYNDSVNSFAMACRARLNEFGDPELLRSDRCESDDTCPGGGRCREGICLFGYECNLQAACQSGQHCSNNVCVHVREQSCSSSEPCGGLVCEAARCEACEETGARACAGDAVCAPDGRCLSPSAAYGGDDPDSIALATGERVQGGALTCSLTQATGGARACLWLVLLPLAGRWSNRRLRRRRSKHGGAR